MLRSFQLGFLSFLRNFAPELLAQLFQRGPLSLWTHDWFTWSWHLVTRTPLWSRWPGPATSRPAQLMVSLPGWSVPPPPGGLHGRGAGAGREDTPLRSAQRHTSSPPADRVARPSKHLVSVCTISLPTNTRLTNMFPPTLDPTGLY